MPVFISYRHTDSQKANQIYTRLTRNGIKAYLDQMDKASRTTDDITEVITTNIKICSHLIAVVSNSTSQSWWVPFEIGEATITDRRIATFQTGYTSLPEYLKKWPVMTVDSHLDMFIREYKAEQNVAKSMLINESLSKTRSSDNFHNKLKASIRRTPVY